MSEFNRSNSAKTWPAPGTAVAAAVLREAEAWARTQSEMLSGVEAIWSGWLKRQGEAIDAGTRSLRQMFDCRNPVELVQLQQQWVADAMCRAASDIGNLAKDATAVTQRAAGADRFAASLRDQLDTHGAPAAQPKEGAAVQRAAAE
jgi:uncharacterized protein (DUF1800 family)